MQDNNHIVTLCCRCQSLIVISSESYKDQEKYFNKEIPNQIKSKVKSIEEIPFYQTFMNSTKRAKKIPNHDFPLCNTCLDKYIRSDENYNRIINEAISAIEGSVHQIQQCKYYMADEANTLMPEMPTQIVFRNNYVEPEKFVTRASLRALPKKQSMVNALPFYAFRINVTDFYGIINSMRVGYLEQYPVPREEIYGGLYMIVRILLIYMHKLHMPPCYITLGSTIMFHIQGRNIEFNYPTNKKEYKDFNICLSKLMELYELVFDILQKQGISGPNVINSSRNTIGDTEYLLHHSDTLGFTLGMRLLLIDIKSVQVLDYVTHIH